MWNNKNKFIIFKNSFFQNHLGLFNQLYTYESRGNRLTFVKMKGHAHFHIEKKRKLVKINWQRFVNFFSTTPKPIFNKTWHTLSYLRLHCSKMTVNSKIVLFWLGFEHQAFLINFRILYNEFKKNLITNFRIWLIDWL